MINKIICPKCYMELKLGKRIINNDICIKIKCCFCNFKINTRITENISISKLMTIIK